MRRDCCPAGKHVNCLNVTYANTPVLHVTRLEFGIPPPKHRMSQEKTTCYHRLRIPGFVETPFSGRDIGACLGRSVHRRCPGVPTGHLPLQASSLRGRVFHRSTYSSNQHIPNSTSRRCCTLLPSTKAANIDEGDEDPFRRRFFLANDAFPKRFFSRTKPKTVPQDTRHKTTSDVGRSQVLRRLKFDHFNLVLAVSSCSCDRRGHGTLARCNRSNRPLYFLRSQQLCVHGLRKD